MNELFKLPTITDPTIKGFATEIMEQNKQNDFLKYFIENNGYPLWQASLKSQSLQSSIAIIPLVLDNKKEVNGFILAKKNLNNQFTFCIYRKNSFANHNKRNPNSNLTALNVQNILSYFNAKEFNIKRKSFAKKQLTKANSSSTQGKTKNYPSVENSSLASLRMGNQDSTIVTLNTSCFTFNEETLWYWNPDGDAANDNGDEYYLYSTFQAITVCVEGEGGGEPGPSPIWWVNDSSQPGGGGSGGNYGINHGFAPELVTPIVHQYLEDQLNLNTPQAVWLNDNWHRAKEIFDFLYGNYTPENVQTAIKHLGEMMANPDYNSFVQQHEGSGNTSLVWWEDAGWVSNHLRLAINSDVAGAPTENLTTAEMLLIVAYPIEAYRVKANAAIAEAETKVRFTTNGLNDKSDAFRHTYWIAMNTKSNGSFLALLFSNAHESETPTQFQLEKDMDLHNNGVGNDIWVNRFRGLPLTNAMIAINVWTAVQNGVCYYLSPINYNDPCFLGCSGNTKGTHGITTATHLTPTNQ